MELFQETLLAKTQSGGKKQLFLFKKGVSICSNSLSLTENLLFVLMKQGRAYPVTELFDFFEEMERDKQHKTQKTQKHKNDHLCFEMQYDQTDEKCLLCIQTS